MSTPAENAIARFIVHWIALWRLVWELLHAALSMACSAPCAAPATVAPAGDLGNEKAGNVGERRTLGRLALADGLCSKTPSSSSSAKPGILFVSGTSQAFSVN